jgi:hypothetical protein
MYAKQGAWTGAQVPPLFGALKTRGGRKPFNPPFLPFNPDFRPFPT